MSIVIFTFVNVFMLLVAIKCYHEIYLLYINTYFIKLIDSRKYISIFRGNNSFIRHWKINYFLQGRI